MIEDVEVAVEGAYNYLLHSIVVRILQCQAHSPFVKDVGRLPDNRCFKRCLIYVYEGNVWIRTGYDETSPERRGFNTGYRPDIVVHGKAPLIFGNRPEAVPRLRVRQGLENCTAKLRRREDFDGARGCA